MSTERELPPARERERVQRQMLGRVIEAQEAERARVARDLHDQIGQSLTSVLLGLRLVDSAVASEHPDLGDVRARMEEVRALVVHALDEVRRLAFDLRPTVLDDVGLVAALRRLGADVSARTGLVVDLTLDGIDDGARLAAEVETVLYRVAQEALTNVARHARASRACVEIGMDGRRSWARISDDGAGFDVTDGALRSLGLAGMQERATLVEGRVRIDSKPGAGTTVTIEVPR